MAGRALIFALALSSVQAAVMRGGSSAFLGNAGGMRPDIAARTFSSVEDEWRSQASSFLDCNASTPEGKTCRSQAMAAFSTSCAKVVDAIVSGSDGDRDNAREYMNDVCAQSLLTGWKQATCKELSMNIFDYGMNANSYANRQKFHSKQTCAGFFSAFIDGEEKRKAQEDAERAEQEKKAAEEAAAAQKKKEEEEAEAKKKADEEAKVRAAEEAAKHKEEEEKERAKSVQQKAEEAKAKAAEAAERLAQKKAEAEQMQKEAQLKLEEAAKAEEDHKAALAAHEKARLLLNNATQAGENVSNLLHETSNSTAVLASAPNVTASNNSQLETSKAAPEEQKNTSEAVMNKATNATNATK